MIQSVLKRAIQALGLGFDVNRVQTHRAVVTTGGVTDGQRAVCQLFLFS